MCSPSENGFCLIHAQAGLVETITGVYRQWGFEALETSAFEYADALGKFLPDDDRPNAGVFAIQDDDEQWMSLRYDLTAPLARFVAEAATAEGVTVAERTLARFQPVAFDDRVVDTVAAVAAELGHSVKRLPSGAGHDAQMMARLCPTGMVFVPSRDGISHNPAEYTEPDDLVAGADVLLGSMLALDAMDLSMNSAPQGRDVASTDAAGGTR